MNQHILIAMDRENRTQEELKDNYSVADAVNVADDVHKVLFDECGTINGRYFNSMAELLELTSKSSNKLPSRHYTRPNSTKAYKKSRKAERQRKKKGRRK